MDQNDEQWMFMSKNAESAFLLPIYTAINVFLEPTVNFLLQFTSFIIILGSDLPPWQKCYLNIHHSFLGNWMGKWL